MLSSLSSKSYTEIERAYKFKRIVVSLFFSFVSNYILNRIVEIYRSICCCVGGRRLLVFARFSIQFRSIVVVVHTLHGMTIRYGDMLYNFFFAHIFSPLDFRILRNPFNHISPNETINIEHSVDNTHTHTKA